MIELVSFLIVILFSLIIIKIGSIALEAKGLSKDIAQFQAHSAFSGVGFTTQESESLMQSSVRRKILRFLMLMGSAGLTSAVATLILAFIKSNETVHIAGYGMNSAFFNLMVIFIVLLFVFLLSRTDLFDHLIRRMLKRPLQHIKAKVNLYDFEKVLGLSQGNSIVSFDVPKNHWMEDKVIGKLKLQKEGVLILGIFRKINGTEQYIATPSDNFKIHRHDKVVVYCKESIAENLATREKGKTGQYARVEAEIKHKNFNALNKLTEEKVTKEIKK